MVTIDIELDGMQVIVPTRILGFPTNYLHGKAMD